MIDMLPLHFLIIGFSCIGLIDICCWIIIESCFEILLTVLCQLYFWGRNRWWLRELWETCNRLLIWFVSWFTMFMRRRRWWCVYWWGWWLMTIENISWVMIFYRIQRIISLQRRLIFDYALMFMIEYSLRLVCWPVLIYK